MDALTVVSSVIVASGLRKSFGEVDAVVDLSFEVGAGTVLGLLGPNGAGKTTTIKMLTTLLPIDGGTASVAGFDLGSQPEAVRRVIGVAGQSAAIDEKLTARENLELFARLYKIPKPERTARVEELIDRFDLGEFAHRVAATYSGGQRRRLDVVAALVAKPPAIFLDEPTTGLDPRSRKELWAEIRSMADAGAAVVLTTQYLDEADQLSDRIVIIDRGVVVATGTGEELKTDLGRDVLEVHVWEAADLERAAVLAHRGGSPAGTDASKNLLAVQLAGGSTEGLELLRRLEDGGIRIQDFQFRRPTLDDVFLTHTERKNP